MRPGERLVHRDPLDERDIAFLKRASTGRGKPINLDFYASLFEFKQEQLSGDITPPYCNIRDETVSAIAHRFPGLRVLLLVREPVARVWSRICMAYTGNSFDTQVLNDVDAFRAYIREQHKLGGLSATQVLARWQNHAPHTPFRVFFFDHLESDPAALRQDILAYLGADPQKESGHLPPEFNRKAKTKLEMTPIVRDVLVDYFRQEILASAEVFGGPARAWPAIYGL
jgi:Sulfotransferase family